jgi:hypothetical protein
MRPGELPEVIPCAADPDFECVRIGSSVATPPAGGSTEGSEDRLCPEGYVPRRRRRPYDSSGKIIQPGSPPERNPTEP